MERVGIVAASVAQPKRRIRQDEAASRIAAAVGYERQVNAIARGTQIESRPVCLPADEVARLRSIEERNTLYERLAPLLAMEAACGLHADPEAVSLLVTSSCTGYMIPGLDVRLARDLRLRPSTTRLPITEAGCSGGAVAMARAFDHLQTRPGSSAVAVATEICCLAFHADAEEGNLTSALLFSDGAGAVLLKSGFEADEGLEVHDSASMLVPCEPEVLGFRLTNQGFYPLLSRNLVDYMLEPTACAVGELLSRHGLAPPDVGFWLVHPGGPRVLEAMQSRLCVAPEAMRWSWQTLRASGNASSAAIIDVLHRYLNDPEAPRGWGVLMAFGPGVSIEMLLVHRC